MMTIYYNIFATTKIHAITEKTQQRQPSQTQTNKQQIKQQKKNKQTIHTLTKHINNAQ